MKYSNNQSVYVPAGNVSPQTPVVGVRGYDAAGRFCTSVIVIAAFITFFCFIDISEWQRHTSAIGGMTAGVAIFCGSLYALGISLRAKVIIASAAAAVSLFFLLNLTFTDGTPYKSYSGCYVEKNHIITRHRNGAAHRYEAVYRAENGRVKYVDLSDREYWDNDFPQSVTMYEHTGLFGIKLYNDPTSPPRRVASLFLALDFYWLAAIYFFSKRNLSFGSWRRWIAMGAVAVSMILFMVAGGGALADGVYVATIIVSGAAMILALLLAVNYLCISDYVRIPVILTRKSAYTSGKFGTIYTLYLLTPSGYRMKWTVSREEYEAAVEGGQMALNVARGRFGMMIVNPFRPA